MLEALHEDATEFDHVVWREGAIVPLHIAGRIGDEPIRATAKVHLGRSRAALVHPACSRANHDTWMHCDAVQTRRPVNRRRCLTNRKVKLESTNTVSLHFAIESHDFEFDATQSGKRGGNVGCCWKHGHSGIVAGNEFGHLRNPQVTELGESVLSRAGN